MKFLFLVLMVISCLAQQQMFDSPLSPRIANYNIRVSLDPETKRLSGNQVLTWRNDSGDRLDELRFHLYLNAFRNEESTFMRESGGFHRRSAADKKEGWGWIEVTRLQLPDGADLTDKIEFISPDDGNEMDKTVFRIELAVPLEPGAVIKLEMDFEAKLPRVFARSGYAGDFFLVGQWFPKIGVYEEAGERYATVGQWNCHQYHSNGEFFADFGNYNVRITVPNEYTVGATGVQLGSVKNDDGTRTDHYYCEDVHDFAWTADKDFTVLEDSWRHVKIKYLVQPLHISQSHRQLQSAKNALEYFDDWFGTYPYPVLTIVDPKYRGRGAGGMEYPTFVTAGTSWLRPEGYRLPEEVVVHEIGHNYFYGLLASNEFEEAWLDEGFTTYAETKAMDHYYGKGEGSALSLFGVNVWNWQQNWFFYSRQPGRDRIYRNSWEYERGGYFTFTYSKPCLMLLTLENYIGPDMMKSVMRSYFDRYKFKHPTSVDFIKTVNDVTGEDYNWYFDQVLYGSCTLDYKLDRIQSRYIAGKARGIFSDPLAEEPDSLENDSTAAIEPIADNDSSAHKYENKVIISREGEVYFPVEVLIELSNGEQIYKNWDGKSRFRVFTIPSRYRVVSAEIDPERKVLLDANFLNNSKTIKIRSSATLKYSTRWLFWMQNFLHLLSIFS